MIEYLKQNHLSILIIVFLAVSSFGGGSFGAINLPSTINTNPHTFQQGLTTTTISASGAVAVQEFTQGGGIVTLTDANGGTYTLTEAELLSGNYLKYAAGGAGQAAVTLQLPATSTLTTLIPNAGDCRDFIYDAGDLAAATTTTITAGTDMDLIAYTTADDVIDGAEFAQITMCRLANTDVTVFTTEMLRAD